MMKYGDAPEWSDIVPIPLPYNDKNPVVQIMYSDRFKDVYSYMAAIMEKKEYSHRALLLTNDAIECNPANYTVWHYRREILRHLKMDLAEEMEFSASVIEDQPKNYQVWHHRRCLIEMSGDHSLELELTAASLSIDNKNYHAWDHRQWVVQQYSCWEKELEYIDELLALDLRNNSAWNHRYFVIENSEGWNTETVRRELDYATSLIRKAPNNESPWNYANGVIKKNKLQYSDFPQLKDLCTSLHEAHIPSNFVLSTLADIHVESGEKEAAIEIFEKMQEQDSIRGNYWKFRQQQLEGS